MQNTSNISREQAIVLMIMSTGGIIAYTLPTIASVAGRTAPIANLVNFILLIPLGIWIMYLGKFYPGGTIFDILEMSIGKFFCKAIIIIYILINIALAALLINLIAETVKTYFLQLTPVWVIMLFIVLMCLRFAAGNIRDYGFFVELLFVLFLLTYFGGLSLAAIKNANAEHFFPIFDVPFSQFIRGTLMSFGTNSEDLLYFMILIGSIAHPHKHRMWIVKALAIAAIIEFIATIVLQASLGAEEMARVSNVGINASINFQLGQYIQGLEVFILAYLLILTIVKISMYMYSIRTTSKKLFSNKNSKYNIALAAVLVFFPAIWLDSNNTAFYLAMTFGLYIILPFSVLVLLLASLGAIKKEKTGGKVMQK